MASDSPRPERSFSIRQLCQEFNCTPRALRFYEGKGLLAPGRQGLNRIYSHKDRGRLQLILRGKRVGLSLSEIREILQLYDKRDGGVAQRAKALSKFRERLITLGQKREEIDQAMDELRAACSYLEKMPVTSRPDQPPNAREYERLARSRAPRGGEGLDANQAR